MQRKFIACLLVLLTLSVTANLTSLYAQEAANAPQTISIQSKVLGEKRDIQVALPFGYNNSKAKYPVLYVLDGENHFNYTVALSQYLTALGVPQMIIVGIPNTVRNRDFTPRQIKEVQNSGGGDNFLKFLSDELLPYIDAHYRTQPYRIMAGHSLTAMYTFYTMLTRPALFNSFIAASPWVISDGGYIVSYASDKLSGNKSLKHTIYYTAGSLEEKELLEMMPKMNSVLDTKAPKELDRRYVFLEGHDHGTLVPVTIYEGLRYIFREWQLPQGVVNMGLDAILGHYKSISEKFGYTIQVPEFVLNIAGYNFLRQQNIEQAIAIFKKNVELYPESANTYDSLGEAYELSNQLAAAGESYQKAYELGSASKDRNTEVFRTNMERVQKLLKK